MTKRRSLEIGRLEVMGLGTADRIDQSLERLLVHVLFLNFFLHFHHFLQIYQFIVLEGRLRRVSQSGLCSFRGHRLKFGVFSGYGISFPEALAILATVWLVGHAQN